MVPWFPDGSYGGNSTTSGLVSGGVEESRTAYRHTSDAEGMVSPWFEQATGICSLVIGGVHLDLPKDFRIQKYLRLTSKECVRVMCLQPRASRISGFYEICAEIETKFLSITPTMRRASCWSWRAIASSLTALVGPSFLFKVCPSRTTQGSISYGRRRLSLASPRKSSVTKLDSPVCCPPALHVLCRGCCWAAQSPHNRPGQFRKRATRFE